MLKANVFVFNFCPLHAVLTLIFSLWSVQADTKINAKDIHYLFCFCFALFSFGRKRECHYSNPVIKILGTFFQPYSQLIIALYIVQ